MHRETVATVAAPTTRGIGSRTRGLSADRTMMPSPAASPTHSCRRVWNSSKRRPARNPAPMEDGTGITRATRNLVSECIKVIEKCFKESDDEMINFDKPQIDPFNF